MRLIGAPGALCGQADEASGMCAQAMMQQVSMDAAHDGSDDDDYGADAKIAPCACGRCVPL